MAKALTFCAERGNQTGMHSIALLRERQRLPWWPYYCYELVLTSLTALADQSNVVGSMQSCSS